MKVSRHTISSFGFAVVVSLAANTALSQVRPQHEKEEKRSESHSESWTGYGATFVAGWLGSVYGHPYLKQGYNEVCSGVSKGYDAACATASATANGVVNGYRRSYDFVSTTFDAVHSRGVREWDSATSRLLKVGGMRKQSDVFPLRRDTLTPDLPRAYSKDKTTPNTLLLYKMTLPMGHKNPREIATSYLSPLLVLSVTDFKVNSIATDVETREARIFAASVDAKTMVLKRIPDDMVTRVLEQTVRMDGRNWYIIDIQENASPKRFDSNSRHGLSNAGSEGVSSAHGDDGISRPFEEESRRF